MAAADGMWAGGVDTGGFNTEINSIAEARTLWSDMSAPLDGHAAWERANYRPGCLFWQANIMDFTFENFDLDVILLFSTWAYIYNDYGRERAFQLLADIVKSCGILFFETQLAGDGPGPDFLVTDDDVANMLGQFGTPQPLATIPVTGRPASRTVWRVSRGVG